MAANFDWFRQTVDRLAVSDSRRELLSELKVALCGLSARDLSSVANLLPLAPIFDSVNTTEKDQLELACDVLGKLMGALEPSTVLAQYGPQIQRTLMHPAPRAKELVLRELDRAVTSHVQMVERLSAEQDLLVCIIDCLSLEEMSAARYAISLMKSLGSCPVGLSALYSPITMQALQVASSKGDIIRFRVYEVVVAVSAQSDEGLKASQNSGFLRALFSELRGDDILAQLNVLEMTTALALQQHSLVFLDEQGILDFLAEKLTNSENDPLSSFLIPGLIKFFGNVAQSRPDEMVKRFPTLVSMMFETLEASDMAVLGTGMETLGFIATTLKGKYMLQSQGSKIPETLRRMVQKLPTLPTDVKVRLLNSISNILQLQVADQNNQSLSMTKRWFEALSPTPMDFVMSLCRQPFPEIRLAGFQLLHVLATNPWGQEYIVRAPGFVEYLMDRSTESLKPCKDAKFDVVRSLVTSPSSSSVMNPDVLEQLKDFMNQGEFYTRGETEVAIEGAS
ncbi:26S proteasome non-ATPase regulatory subunit 5-like isoform X1 [Thrips palmi]|uniref:26S proteasome non-ATPase regulatory subunit 5 n=1 Tax=Thrips palmi TaxID=161013 RepID=A0A6P8YNS8_THRPL|nr:26S proteasome non-ATPase regulatory subunit 5-like isoform X1 [Thrips palmi]